MELLLVIVTALALVGLGFWLMHRVDRFARGGGFHPYWDEAAEQAALRKLTQPRQDCSDAPQQDSGNIAC
ncbi:MAG: hypothetical protein RR350_01815 [Oscillibacter sp.]